MKNIEATKQKIDELYQQFHDLENVPNIHSITYENYIKTRKKIFEKINKLLKQLSILELEELLIYFNNLEIYSLFKETILAQIQENISEKKSIKMQPDK